jgi:hypothetical protein
MYAALKILKNHVFRLKLVQMLARSGHSIRYSIQQELLGKKKPNYA